MTDENRYMGMEADSETVSQQAEHWFARRRDGVRPAEQESAFQRWLAAHPSHAQAYSTAELSWESLKLLQTSPRMRELAASAIRDTAHQAKLPGYWKPLLMAASVAAVALIGINLLRSQAPIEAPAAVSYRTAVGEQRTELLADGSRLILNTDTQLDVRYANTRRDIVLRRGEVLFAVAKDAARPFAVAAADGTITAFGTQFQVREAGGNISVTLLEGSVQVARERHGETQRLVPGEQAAYRAMQSGIAIRKVDPAAAVSWTQGRLDFRDLALADAVSEANRYSALKLRIGDPTLEGLAVSGSFRAGDNAGVAAALAAAFPIRIAETTDSEIVLRRR